MNTVVLEKEQSWVISGDETLREFVDDWRVVAETIGRGNTELFGNMFRDFFNVPEGMSTDEVDEFITAEYGDVPIQNNRFAELYTQLLSDWNEARMELPSLVENAIKEGYQVEPVDVIINLVV